MRARKPAATPPSLLLLALLAVCVFALAPVHAAGVGVGDTAPLFAVSASDGTTFRLADSLAHHPVLVAFVAARCRPCEESIPAIRKIRDLHAEEDSIEVVCLAASSEAALRSYTENGRHPETAEWFPDRASADGWTVADRYGVLGIPVFFLVGRDGKVLWRHVGRLTWDRVEREIGNAIRGVASTRPDVRGGS